MPANHQYESKRAQYTGDSAAGKLLVPANRRSDLVIRQNAPPPPPPNPPPEPPPPENPDPPELRGADVIAVAAC
jgi:hypothetical protein